MPDFRILQQTDDPNVYRVIDRRVSAVDAGDAFRKALASGKIPVAAAQSSYDVLDLDGSQTLDLNLSIHEHGS